MLTIAKELGVPRTTLEQGFKREFGLDTSQIKTLPDLADALIDRHVRKHGIGPGVIPSRYEGISPEKLLPLLKVRPLRLSEIADALDRSPAKVESAIDAMQMDGIEIQRDDDGRISQRAYFPADPLPTLQEEKSYRLRFGVFSDIHQGSKHTQTSAMKSFVHEAVERYGVRRFLVPGDLFAGVGVYRGQHNELYAHGAQDQVDALANTLPQIKGVEYIVMGGNHDYSLYKQTGTDPIRMLCNQRKDCHYAGYDEAEVPLIVGPEGQIVASARLWHPSGGVPYALSYRGQRYAAELARSELTDVILSKKASPTVRYVFWGHLHVSDFFPHGPIWIIGPGCFEGRNSYLKAKGLVPVIQGLVIEAEMTELGIVQRQSITPISYIEQEQDYKCGWIPELERASKALDPLFSASPIPEGERSIDVIAQDGA